MNIFRNSTYVVFLLSACCLYGEEQSLVHSPALHLNEKMMTGIWEVGGSKIEIRLNDQKNITSIIFGNKIEYFLPEYSFVSDVKIPKNAHALILDIASWSNLSSGINSRGIIYVMPKENFNWDGVLEVVECLTPEYLRNLDGYRRSVVEIGDVDQFPIVEVKILYYLSRSLPSEVSYEWIEWDLKTRLPLSNLSPSGWRPEAERAERGSGRPRGANVEFKHPNP